MKHFNFGTDYTFIIATIVWGIIVFIFWNKGVNYIMKNKDKKH